MVSRIIEIFPSIDSSLVDYDPQRGIGRFRLTTQETMGLVMTILGGLMGLSYSPQNYQIDNFAGNGQPPAAAAAPESAPTVAATENGGAIVPTTAQPVENPFGLSDALIAQLSSEAKAKLGINDSSN